MKQTPRLLETLDEEGDEISATDFLNALDRLFAKRIDLISTAGRTWTSTFRHEKDLDELVCLSGNSCYLEE